MVGNKKQPGNPLIEQSLLNVKNHTKFTDPMEYESNKSFLTSCAHSETTMFVLLYIVRRWPCCSV